MRIKNKTKLNKCELRINIHYLKKIIALLEELATLTKAQQDYETRSKILCNKVDVFTLVLGYEERNGVYLLFDSWQRKLIKQINFLKKVKRQFENEYARN